MATLGMKSQLFLKPSPRFRYRSEVPRPRRITRVTNPSAVNFVERDDLDPELTLAIQESLKLARQNDVTCITPKSKTPNGKLSHRPLSANASCQTETDPSSNDNLTLTITSNLNVIEEQQQLMCAKDERIRQLTSENETLQCRLERMERRLSILKQKDDNIAISPVPSPASLRLLRKTPAKRDEPSECNTYCKRLAAETCTLLNKPQQSVAVKRRLSSTNTPTTPTRTQTVRQAVTSAVTANGEILTSSENYHVLPCNAILRSPTIQSKDFSEHLKQVEVPRWTVKTLKNIYQMEGTENITDEAYMRRHQKPEIEEKRRKRWDIQQQREQEAYERLREKGAGDVTTPLDHSSTHSIFPSLAGITHIDVREDLPVSVFGRAVPSVTQRNFDLPWTSKKVKTPRRK